MPRSELARDPVRMAEEVVRRVLRGSAPRSSTIRDIFEGCRTWGEVLEVARVLAEVLPVSVRGDMVVVRVATRRRGNDIAVTKVVARLNGGIKVGVVNHYI